jgi:hypothetical protein
MYQMLAIPTLPQPHCQAFCLGPAVAFCRPVFCLFILTYLTSRWAIAAEVPTGAVIYKNQCANCHGPRGGGVAKKAEEPLRGKKSLSELIQVINKTMPEKKPKECTGEAARRVAKYIYDTFYLTKSNAHASRIKLSRLTVRQYLSTTADLMATFVGKPHAVESRGLSGAYYKTRRFNDKDRVLERVDPQIDFNYGAGKPDGKIPKAEAFSIRWQGGVLAEDTGDYEFIVKSENGVKLWVNNHQTPLMDRWVSSPGRPTEHRVTIRLLGGRVYPIQLDMFKFKDKSASITLMWKPPHRAAQVIPERNLMPKWMQETFVVRAAFPPDDSVSGYERGTSVSQAWDQAATAGAIETAAFVVDRLDKFSGTESGAADRAKKAKQFCHKFAQRAFRRPLSDAQKKFFIDARFKGAENVESAVRRCVLLVMKSPRFLYPGIGSSKTDDYDAAAHLAIGLWDSLPDKALLSAASRKQLHTPEQIGRQAKRMLADPRAKSKLRYFFHHWLLLDEKGDLVKDAKRFPKFDGQVASDLRTSLEMFLDEVVWSEKSDYRQLLLADYVYMNDRLAKFYGVDVPASGRFEKVPLQPKHRAGVVTHPYMLSSLAYHHLSSPIHRGVFVTRQLLGRTLKPPPQATEFKDADFDPGMTTREKVALITKPAACQSCHQVINPLGFSLEHFDAVGRYREKEQKKPINAVSPYTTTAGKTVKLDGAKRLAQLIADSRQAQGAFVDQLFHQAVKQPINAYGLTARDDLIKAFAASDYHIQQLLIEIMKVSVLYNPAEKP